MPAKSEIEGSNLTLAFKFQRNTMFLLRSLVKIQYCGDQEVACSASDGQAQISNPVAGSVISFISPSSGGFPDPV